MPIESSTSIEELLELCTRTYRNDDFRKALRLASKAAKQAIAEGCHDLVVKALLIQMNSCMSLGERTRAKNFAEKAIKLASAKCTPDVHANALIESGYVSMQYLEYACAEERTAAALVLARDYTLPALQADTLVQLADLDRLRGNYQEALVYARSAWNLGETLEGDRAKLEAHVQQALLYGGLGRYVEALEVLEQVESASRDAKLDLDPIY